VRYSGPPVIAPLQQVWLIISSEAATMTDYERAPQRCLPLSALPPICSLSSDL